MLPAQNGRNRLGRGGLWDSRPRTPGGQQRVRFVGCGSQGFAWDQRGGSGLWPAHPGSPREVPGKPGPCKSPSLERAPGPCVQTGGSGLGSGEEQGAALNGCLRWKFLCICNNKITIICSLTQLDQSSIVPSRVGRPLRLSPYTLHTQPARQPVRALEISMQMALIRWASCQAAPLWPCLCEGPDSPAPAPAHPPRSSQEGLRGAPPD